MEDIIYLTVFGWSMTVLAALFFFILWRKAQYRSQYWKSKCLDDIKTLVGNGIRARQK